MNADVHKRERKMKADDHESPHGSRARVDRSTVVTARAGAWAGVATKVDIGCEPLPLLLHVRL